jgi:hypothetical protein
VLSKNYIKISNSLLLIDNKKKQEISDIYKAVSTWLSMKKNGTYFCQNDVINNGLFGMFKVKFIADEDRKKYLY